MGHSPENWTKEGAVFPMKNKNKIKRETFQITAIFEMECVWTNKGNAAMGKCIIISCAVSLFL